MNLGDYQEAALNYLLPQEHLTENEKTMVVALGLGGEAGEAVEVVKKHFRNNKPIKLHHLEEELGDTLWQIAVLADRYGLSLEDIAKTNLDKLRERHGK